MSSWRFYGNVRTIALCETLKAAGLVEGSDGEYDLTDAGYLLAVERQEALDALGITADQLRK